MKIITAGLVILTLSSCGQIQRILDGTEHLPSQIQETNNGMAKTNESIRMQKVSIALDQMLKKENRRYLSPIPGDMMPAGKVLAESLTVDEALLFVKDFMKKINEEAFANRYPLVDTGTEEGKKLAEDFYHDKLADLSMISIVSGFLPEDTLNAMIKQESEQGAYRDVLFQILMLRASFNNDLMLKASVMNEKLDTLGKIQKAFEYNDKIDFISKLNFTNQIALQITGFDPKQLEQIDWIPNQNELLSKKFDTNVALANWKKIYENSKLDFKAQSFSTNPKQNEAAVKEYTDKQAALLEKIQKKIDAYPK